MSECGVWVKGCFMSRTERRWVIVGVAVDNGRMEYLPLEEAAHCLREMPGRMAFSRQSGFS